MPSVCAGYGLAEGTEEETFRSKFKYVMARLEPLPAAEVLWIARAVPDEEGHADLGEALAKFRARRPTNHSADAPAHRCGDRCRVFVRQFG